MSFRVHIVNEFMGKGYQVYLLEEMGQGRIALYTHDNRIVWPEPAANADPNDYFATIPYDAAHAFLAALSRQLGAVEHPEQLRRDFEHERGRVDKLIDWLMVHRA